MTFREILAAPMFAPLAPVLEDLPSDAPCAPTWDALNRIARARGVASGGGAPVTFTPATPPLGAASYESVIFHHGTVPSRTDSWHDLFNGLAWMTFPRAKAALNAAHHATLAQPPAGDAGRGRARDRATLLDESGVAVACTDPTLATLLTEFRWHDLFVTSRPRVSRCMRFMIVGHGLYEQCRRPFIGLTGHAVIIPVTERFIELPEAAQRAHVDEVLAGRIRQDGANLDLHPLPILGIPGWWQPNESPAFYADQSYFRPGRRSRASRAG